MELIEKGFDMEKINKLSEILSDVKERGVNSLINYGVSEKTVLDLNYLIDNLNKMTDGKHNIMFEVSIVRGQGYYTGTIYEFYTEGFGGAIGAGGRYDKMIEKMTGFSVPAVGASIGFEPVTMLLKEKNVMFDAKENLALIYDEDDDILEVFDIKSKLMEKFNVSLFARAKNMKNFYEKIVEVADCVTSVKDYKEGKEIKILN